MVSRRRSILLMLWLIPLMCFTGCQILESTDVLRHAVGPADMAETAGFTYFSVDFFGDSTNTYYPWITIEEVITIGFQVWVSNGSAESGRFDLYVSPYKESMDFADAELMADNTLPILVGPEVAAGQTLYLDWPGSMAYVTNRERAYPIFEDGRLTFFYYSETDNLTLDSVAVIITAKVTLRY